MKSFWFGLAILAVSACGKTVSTDSGSLSGSGHGTATTPVVTVTSPSDKSVVTTPSVQVIGGAAASEAITSLTYQLNGQGAVPVTIATSTSVAFGFTVSGLSVGPNTIVVSATTATQTGQSSPLTVTFTADSTSFQAPLAANESLTALTETVTPVTLAGSGGNGAPLSYAIATTPAHGTVTGTAPMLTYRSAPGFTGLDTLSYTVSDGTTTTAPATVAITVTDGTALFVDAGHGSDANTGRALDRAKRTIQAAIDDAAGPYSTININAGTYPEYLTINKTLTVLGPTFAGDIAQGTNEPEVVIQPSAGQLADYVAIVNIGDTTNAGGSTPVVTLNNVKIDGSLIGPSIVPNANTKYIGVAVHPAASVKLDHDFFWYQRLANAYLGDQTGLALYSTRGDIDVRNSLFAESGKQQITLHASDDTSLPPNHATMVHNHLVGTDPTAIGTQNSENGVIFWNNVQATVTGNLFEGFGDAGPNKADMGQARVAHDYSTGVAFGFAYTSASAISATITNTFTGNTFRECQALFEDDSAYTGSPAPAPIFATTLLATNTVQGGYFVASDPALAYEVFGARTSDPNFINYVIAWDAGWPDLLPFFDYGCHNGTGLCQVVLGPGTYCMTAPLFDLSTVTPQAPPSMTLVAESGTVNIYTPDTSPPAGSLPAAYHAGSGVTIHFAEACPH